MDMGEHLDSDFYFRHLKRISRAGRWYKKFFLSPLLFLTARRFGPRIVEVGAGIGSGVLGTFSSNTVGLDVNSYAVNYCRELGLSVKLIDKTGHFPCQDGEFDACILDNVLEHIENPQKTLDECYRITGTKGALVVVVPGSCGFAIDPDHKVYYDTKKLNELDPRWSLLNCFATPSLFLSETLSRRMKQYCVVAVFVKKDLPD